MGAGWLPFEMADALGHVGVWFGVFVFVALAQDKSLGISIFLYGLPITLIVLTLVTFFVNGANWPTHRRLVLAAWALPFLSWLPLRSEGYMASFVPQLRWRWSPTNEAIAVAAFNERQKRTDQSQPLPSSELASLNMIGLVFEGWMGMERLR